MICTSTISELGSITYYIYKFLIFRGKKEEKSRVKLSE